MSLYDTKKIQTSRNQKSKIKFDQNNMHKATTQASLAGSIALFCQLSTSRLRTTTLFATISFPLLILKMSFDAGSFWWVSLCFSFSSALIDLYDSPSSFCFLLWMRATYKRVKVPRPSFSLQFPPFHSVSLSLFIFYFLFFYVAFPY